MNLNSKEINANLAKIQLKIDAIINEAVEQNPQIPKKLIQELFLTLKEVREIIYGETNLRLKDLIRLTHYIGYTMDVTFKKNDKDSTENEKDVE